MKRSPRTSPLEDTSSPPQINQRRLFMRQQPRTLVYVELEGGNGGIALNLSEDGLCIQAVVALMDDSLPHIRFQLPGGSQWIETSATIIWANESRKLVGAKFIDLPETSRRAIREWLQGESLTPEAPAPHERASAPPAESIRPRRPEIGATRRPLSSMPSKFSPPASDEFTEDAEPSLPPPPSRVMPEPPAFAKRPAAPAPPPAKFSPPPTPPQPPAAPPPPGVAASSVAPPSYPPAPPVIPAPAAAPAWTPPSARQVVVPSAGALSGTDFRPVFASERFQTPVDESKAGVSGLIVFFVFLGVVCVAAGWAAGAGNFSSVSDAFTGIFASAAKGNASSLAPSPAAPSEIAQIDVVPLNGSPWSVPLAAAGAPESVDKKPNPPEQPPRATDEQTGDAGAATPQEAANSTPAATDNAAPSTASQQAAPAPTSSAPTPTGRTVPKYDTQGAASSSAELVYRVDPIYPADAIRQHISGVVKLRLTVLPDGTVGQVYLVSGPPLLVDAAINAARRWRYVPATEDNEAKESSVDIGLVFQLP